MVFTTTGDFFIYLALVITSLRFSRPRALDILDQTLGAFRLGWRPVVAVMFPFGMAFGFNFDSLLAIIGGRFFAGGAIAPSVIRQAGPLVVAMILTAVVGAAVAADLGARKVRDEIDAMRVMGVNPYPRLVIPRILGTAIASPFLYFMGVAAAIIGGFILLVVVRSSNAGSFITGMKTLVQVRDVTIAASKSVLFGTITGAMACFFGLRATGGPTGVASRVRTSIIATVSIVFVVDYAITSLVYVQ